MWNTLCYWRKECSGQPLSVSLTANGAFHVSFCVWRIGCVGTHEKARNVRLRRDGQYYWYRGTLSFLFSQFRTWAMCLFFNIMSSAGEKSECVQRALAFLQYSVALIICRRKKRTRLSMIEFIYAIFYNGIKNSSFFAWSQNARRGCYAIMSWR